MKSIQIDVIAYCLGNSDNGKRSVCVQYVCNLFHCSEPLLVWIYRYEEPTVQLLLGAAGVNVCSHILFPSISFYFCIYCFSSSWIIILNSVDRLFFSNIIFTLLLFFSLIFFISFPVTLLHMIFPVHIAFGTALLCVGGGWHLLVCNENFCFNFLNVT